MNIDLTKERDGSMTLVVEFEQEFPVKLGFLGSNRKNKGRLRVFIDELQHEGIIVRDPKALVQLKVDKQKSSDLIVDLARPMIHFDTLLQPKEILDCTEIETKANQNKPYFISYKVGWALVPVEKRGWINHIVNWWNKRKTKNVTPWVVDPETGDAKVFTHEIYFSNIQQIPVINFSPSPLEFKEASPTDEKERCGVLELGLTHFFNRAPYLNMEFGLSVIESSPIGRIVRTDIASIKTEDRREENPYAPVGDMKLKIKGVSGSPLGVDYDENRKQYTVKNFYVNGTNHRILLPVVWDLSQIKNPKNESEEYLLVMDGKYWSRDDSIHKTDFRNEFPISILRNQKEIGLEVYVSVRSASVQPEKHILEEEKDPLNPDLPASTPPYRVREILVNGGTEREFSLVVRNTADAASHPDAAVKIKNFSIKGPIFEGGVFVRMSAGVKYPILVDKTDIPCDPNEVIILKHKQSKSVTFQYPVNAITGFTKNGVECFETEARYEFSFLYLIDKDGKSTLSFQEFNGMLILPLSVAPAPEWMCIDFGTSAVVAEYGKSIYDDLGSRANNLMDLKSIKDKLLRKAISEQEKEKRTDDNEKDTEFISSLVAFNWLKEIDNLNDFRVIQEPARFASSAILFSPSTRMINLEYQLPCLKSLMGYDHLPKGIFDAALEKDLYKHPLSRIDEIYEIVYRQLFKYYTPKGIEKLVLSFPNTFAPFHLQKLHKIALECIPSLRESRIRFVSESDAVAYYYLSRRNVILKKVGIKRDDWDSIDEHALVYDMGAGSLDLTYFVKTPSTHSTEIEITGKMGVNKAGNYIDYLIAEILAKILKKKDNVSPLADLIEKMLELNRDKRHNAVTPSNCNDLKNYVKNIVKPSLNNPQQELESWAFDKGEELKGIKGEDIITNDLFKEFLHEITDGVFTSFVALFGSDKKIPVDLVIFSGRSMSLQVIRDHIIERIVEYNSQERCRFVDIGAEKFVEKGMDIDHASIKGLKSVVAAGALAYSTLIVKDDGEENRAFKVKNKNVYATYGIMAHSAKGWEWFPLINAKTRPTSLPISRYGMDVARYHSSKYNCFGESHPLTLSLSTIDSIYVLQSYSANTKKDWESDNKEMITILLYKTVENYFKDEQVALEINDENEIILWLGQDSIKMLSHDDFFNSSFRKSMWPVIFSESQNHK